MNRLLLLRPVSRAIRAKGSVQCRKNISRAFSTTPCQNLRATTSVNKKSGKGMNFVDKELFGDFEETPEVEQPEPPPQEYRSSVIHSAGKHKKHEPKHEPKAELSDHEGPEVLYEENAEILHAEEAGVRYNEQGQEVIDFPVSTKPIDLEEYYNSWFSYETRVALAERRLDRYAFVCSILETPYCDALLRNFPPDVEDEFEKLWLSFEISEQEDDSGLLPVLEFFLRKGVQLLAPTQENFENEDYIRFVEPSVAQKSLDSAPIGSWQTKAKEAKSYHTELVPYPNLMEADDLLDPRDVYQFPATPSNQFENQVIVRNHRSIFHEYPEGATDPLMDEDYEGPEIEEDEGGESIVSSIPVSADYYKGLHHSILMYRSVVLQTGKGKIRRASYTVLVGDGNGLVGVGQGKHAKNQIAMKAARIAAVKNMDWVERFEERTIWTEMRAKFGATELILRPRPVGFGLRCNPFLHQILRAAGMKDISAKVWGSRNKLNVIKAAMRMLHAGHAPTSMGDGIGGPGRKMSRGRGVRGKAEVERARGRKLISLRK